MDKPLPLWCGGGKITKKPSFASTLLDFVYRSIDEDENNSRPARRQDTRVLEPSLPCSITSRNKITTALTENPKNASVRKKVILQHRAYTYTTSTSSESPTYGSFSSSDTETVFHPEISMPVPIAWSRQSPEKKKCKAGSIRSKLQELRQTRTPISPRARLTNFLNSLFTTSARKVPKETKDSEYSPASRSYLSKTGSLKKEPLSPGRLKRSVRFDLVSDKFHNEGRVACVPIARERKMKDTVEERLLRRINDDAESDSSSDLFELEDLNARAEPGGGGYRDELPVFKTTYLGTLRASSLRF